LHGSLLPQYRGAAPINWAIINGEKETGVTTFFLKHEIDTGSIIFQDKETIQPEDTVGTVYERLMHKGAQLVLKTVQAIQEGNYPSIPQDEAQEIKHAPKIYKETCEINWDQPSLAIYNFVRGLNPYPTAWTTLAGKNFKIHKVSIATEVNKDKASGDFITDSKKYLYIKTKDGWISIEELQLEGKNRMAIEDYFRGNKL
jgi:methionyl-tRNA formyltransferase